MSITSTASCGMQNALQKVERVAERFAGAAVTPSQSEDLGSDVVDLLSAREQFAANVQVVKAADELHKKAIDMLA